MMLLLGQAMTQYWHITTGLWHGSAVIHIPCITIGLLLYPAVIYHYQIVSQPNNEVALHYWGQ